LQSPRKKKFAAWSKKIRSGIGSIAKNTLKAKFNFQLQPPGTPAEC
jgi:hypothetical protein